MSGATDDLNFIHRFEPAAEGGRALTLLLLHGTGGNESDLLDVGRMIAPNAALLSPRGKVLENGMPRFFRRLSEGVFDEEDLKARTEELAEFIDAAAVHYGLDRESILAVGYSNGANIAASLLLSDPEMLAGAILFKPMTPFQPDALPNLSRKPIFMAAGRRDPIVPPENTERLAAMLRDAGATVTLEWLAENHGLAQEEIQAAADWLAVR